MGRNCIIPVGRQTLRRPPISRPSTIWSVQLPKLQTFKKKIIINVNSFICWIIYYVRGAVKSYLMPSFCPSLTIPSASFLHLPYRSTFLLLLLFLLIYFTRASLAPFFILRVKERWRTIKRPSLPHRVATRRPDRSWGIFPTASLLFIFFFIFFSLMVYRTISSLGLDRPRTSNFPTPTDFSVCAKLIWCSQFFIFSCYSFWSADKRKLFFPPFL